MEKKKLEKDIVFFIPGERGTVFTYKAGHFVNDNWLMYTIDHLEYDMEKKIKWTEDRRQAARKP